MTIKSGTGQACAACKYQRRRCTLECLLAPFFPADQPKMFQNVHRLFGVKNIQNLLKELRPDQKPEAMKSIKFQALQRDKYPIFGCLVEIQQLNYQIHIVEEELQAVLQQLAYYRQQQQQQQQQMSAATEDYMSELQLGVAPPGNAPFLLVDHHEGNNVTQYNCVAPQPSYSNSGNVDYSNINYLDFKENNNVVDSFCEQQQQQQQTYNNSNDNNNPSSIVVHPAQLIVPQGRLSVQQEKTQDYNEMHSCFDCVDDTQSYIDSKEACDSSLESSTSKDSRQLVHEEMAENELKSAAAFFSLTSVN